MTVPRWVAAPCSVALAMLIGAQVYVLSIIPSEVADAAIVASAAGHACLIDEADGYRKLLDESIEWLKVRGVSAEGYLASGNTNEHSIAVSRRLAIDLIVLGHYPPPSGDFLVRQPASRVFGRALKLLRVRRGQRLG